MIATNGPHLRRWSIVIPIIRSNPATSPATSLVRGFLVGGTTKPVSEGLLWVGSSPRPTEKLPSTIMPSQIICEIL